MNNKKYALVFCGTKEKHDVENQEGYKRWSNSINRHWAICRTRARMDGYQVVCCWGDSADNDIRKKLEEDGSYVEYDENLPTPQHYKIDAIYANEEFRAVRTVEKFKELQDHFQHFGIKIVVCEPEPYYEGYDYGDVVLRLVSSIENRLSAATYNRLLNFLSYELRAWRESMEESEEMKQHQQKVDN